MKQLAVYGGGSWGTALSCEIARKTRNVTLYLRNEKIADEISLLRTNKKYLGDVRIPFGVMPTIDINQLAVADVIIIAVPSCSFNEVIDSLKNLRLSKDQLLLVATKGLSNNPPELMSDRLGREFANKVAFMMGPNFAREVAIGLTSSATIASKDIGVAKELAQLMASDNFIIDATDDVITPQIAGIVKNIVAIKSGIVLASGSGENARATLIAQGLQEIAKISKALGGNLETLLGTSIVGDLVLTAYSSTSRNTKFGYDWHTNSYSKSFYANYPSLVEGVETARLIMTLLEPYKLDLPIISSVAKLLEIHAI